MREEKKMFSVLKKIFFFTVVIIWLFNTNFLQAQMKILSTKFLGPVWNEGHAKAFVIAQDGGDSYTTPEGTLWWFGDTFLGIRKDNGKHDFRGGISCSVAKLEKTEKLPPVLKFLTGQDGKAIQAIEFFSDEPWEHYRIWPLAGIFVNGKSYIYYSLIEITGNQLWDFKCVGTGLACSDKPFSVHKRIQPEAGWRFSVSPSAIILTNDWIYLFDVEKRKEQNGVWLARVTPKEIENPTAYQFYCGKELGFSNDREKQVLFLENIYGQVSIVWNEYLKKYILASSSDFFRPYEIRFYLADNPVGPWIKTTTNIYVPEHLQEKKVTLIYCSFFHPELFQENGRIMNLTFSPHLENSWFDANNEMIEVVISKE